MAEQTFDEKDIEGIIRKMEERIKLKEMMDGVTVSLDELSANIQAIIRENKALQFPGDYLGIITNLDELVSLKEFVVKEREMYRLLGGHDSQDQDVAMYYSRMVEKADALLCQLAAEAKHDREGFSKMTYQLPKLDQFTKADLVLAIQIGQQRIKDRLDLILDDGKQPEARRPPENRGEMEKNRGEMEREDPDPEKRRQQEEPVSKLPYVPPKKGSSSVDEKIRERVDYLTKKYAANGGKGKILVRTPDLSYIHAPGREAHEEFLMKCMDARKDLAEKLRKRLATGGDARAFKHIPYIALEVDIKDEQKIMDQLLHKQAGLFKAFGFHGRDIVNVYPTSLHFIPEDLAGVEAPVDKRVIKGSPKPAGYIWNLRNIGVPRAHEYGKGAGVSVLVIDTGCDYNHAELKERFDHSDRGWNFIDNNSNPMDKHYHGTHVSGTIAGNRVGIARDARLYAACCLTASGGSAADIIASIEYAIDKKVQVVNMSLGSYTYLDAMADACKACYDSGIVVVAAAGNDGLVDMPSYPAGYEGVIGVAAVDEQNEHAYFSNQNDTNDISAPGVEVYSTVPDGYDYLSGTSMASPHVAGSLALIRSIYQDASPETLEQLMKNPECSQNLGNNAKKYGAGLVRPDLMAAYLERVPA